VPPYYTLRQRRAVLDAANLAGFTCPVHLVSSVTAAAASYAAKHRAGIAASETPRIVTIVDVGAAVTSVGVFAFTDGSTTEVACECLPTLGANTVHHRLFELVAAAVSAKHGVTLVPTSKAGGRAMRECEKAKKVLSTVGSTRVDVENVCCPDGVDRDLHVDITAAQLEEACGPEKTALRQCITRALSKLDASMSLHSVELIGGGTRIPWVQSLVGEVTGAKPSFTLDSSACVATGAALICSTRPALDTELPAGLSDDEVAAGQALMKSWADREDLIHAESSARNQLEAFLFEMRSALRGSHGDKFNATATKSDLDRVEQWVWDFGDVSGTPERIESYKDKLDSLKASVAGHSKAYFDAVEADRLAVEAALEASAKEMDAQREAEGGDDHDDRKLKKADRLRLVIKNKDEGNELFKGGNYQHAVTRYTKALGHTGKFFDLDEDSKAEVEALKLSLFLNLAQCYLKLELWLKAVGNAESALKIDPSNAKALYRRAYASVQLKNWDQAEADLRALRDSGNEDAACVKLRVHVDAVRAKQAEKQKDFARKMFG
jgi:tetratricopeptide (TPR) repeat protein